MHKAITLQLLLLITTIKKGQQLKKAEVINFPTTTDAQSLFNIVRSGDSLVYGFLVFCFYDFYMPNKSTSTLYIIFISYFIWLQFWGAESPNSEKTKWREGWCLKSMRNSLIMPITGSQTQPAWSELIKAVKWFESGAPLSWGWYFKVTF